MDPLTYGDYPFSMRSLVGQRLPKFTYGESKLVKGSFDFIGINYYTAFYVASAPKTNKINISYATDSLANLTSTIVFIFFYFSCLPVSYFKVNYQ